MIEATTAHREHVDTGLPWMPIVPAHWDLVRNRAIWRRRKVLVGSRHPEYTLLSLTKRGIIVRDVSENKGKFSADMGTSQEVRKGDFVFCLFDVPETPRTVGLSRHDGMITGAYTVLESLRPSTSRYLELLYCALDAHKALSPLYTGLRHTIPLDRLLSVTSPLPPPEEQAAIVRFLEVANRRINRLIRNKRRLIELLDERKQKVVDEVLTCGPDPAVKMKDSGFEWLGQVPRHWITRRLKYLLAPVDERSQTGSERLLSLRMRHGVVPYHDHFSKPPQAATLIGFKKVQPGHVVVNRMRVGFGLMFASEISGLVSPDFGVFQPIADATGPFLGELFRSTSMRAKFHSESKGLGTGKSGFMRLYDDRLLRIPVTYPPTEHEQNAILRMIEESNRESSASIKALDTEIALIQEYRTRLIADVVTGKLDVRAAAANLPEPGDTETELVGGLDDDADVDAAGDVEALDGVAE